MAKNTTKKITSIGGSALIEGIMMRGPKRTTVCSYRTRQDLQRGYKHKHNSLKM